MKEIQQAVWSVNANLPLADVRTLEDLYNRSMAQTSFTLVMLAIAGAMAFVLGLIGVYSVIAYAVSQRRREMGIRVAVGAQPRAVRMMFVRHGLILAVLGVAAGWAIATALTRTMESLLFEVSPIDPVTYVGIAAGLVGAVVAATWIPARQATIVEPLTALRD